MAGETPTNTGWPDGELELGGSSPEVAARVGRIVEHFGRRRVATAIGVSIETVRRYEAGRTPNPRFLSAMVDGLGVSAEWIVMGAGPLLESERRRELVTEASLPESLGELMRRALVPKTERAPVTNGSGRSVSVKRAGVRWETGGAAVGGR